MLRALYILILTGTFNICLAQPLGWEHSKKIVLFDYSGQNTTDYQFKFTFNSAALIAAGEMNADLSDLRFTADCASLIPLSYWIESGVNTSNTRVWVKIPLLAASQVTNIYMHFGNPLAISTSSLTTTFIGPFSSTDSVQPNSSSTALSVGERGFKFSPNQDILLYGLGKYNNLNQAVTLFDAGSQALLRQSNVLGLPLTYNYSSGIAPLWLSAGSQYVLTTSHNALDNVPGSSTSQVGEHLSFISNQYCDGCTSGSFPMNVSATGQEGIPDLLYFIKKTVSPAPFYQLVENDSLEVQLSANVSICLGDSVALSASVTSGSPLTSSWTSAGLSVTNVPGIVVAPSETQTYYYSAVDECANVVTDSIVVNVNQPPAIQIESSQPNSCSGDFVQLVASGAESYLWNGGQTNDTINVAPASTHNYSVTGTDINGCSNQVSFQQVVSFPGVRSQSFELCANEVFVYNGHTYTEEGVYLDTIPMNFGCDSIVITDLTFRAPLNPIVTEQDNSIQTSFVADAYQWINCSDFSAVLNETSTVFNPSVNGSYALTVQFDGCTDTSECIDISTLATTMLLLNDHLKFQNPISDAADFFSAVDRDVIIFDQFGKEVLQFALKSNVVSTIDFSNLPQGSYILRSKTLVLRLQIL